MNEYWSGRFAREGMIWGSEPSPTALVARDWFSSEGVQSVLVPGAGYGRNTKVFSAAFGTWGVELSEAALTLAREWDPLSHFILGSALDADLIEPVDAVYCYGVLHLFLEEDRRRLVESCLQQLKPGGLLYFASFAAEDPNNGCGRQLEPGTYEYKQHKYAHFFSDADLRAQFADTDILGTELHREVLQGVLGDSHEYLLRSITARKPRYAALRL
ncbi:SAM-dependent methyltransferase [Paenibacillus donghaensis]|uniref:SAM-dependent methyltransferase n=1 Tax=Paenibacillus donghaensis TaxID=414771 RepID=A0A2Z2KIZ4_9BACL|nr:SAM-dependent methyltransferase [Paenibacillus donghaensis]